MEEKYAKKYQVECDDCGSIISLSQYQNHDCTSEIAQSKDVSECLEMSEAKPVDVRESDDVVLHLVEAVQARAALWDHTLPLKKRSKDIKDQLWREIYHELNGAVPLRLLEKKWKNLKDTFLKHLKTYTPSGSGRDDKKNGNILISCFFLAEKNASRTTYSNVGNYQADESPSLVDLMSPSSSSSSNEPYVKRPKKNDTYEDLLLNILKEPPPKTTPLSPAMLNTQSILEKLPTRVRMQAEIDILNKVYSLYAEHFSE